MNNRQQGMTKLKALLLVTLVAAIFFALHSGPLADKGDQDEAEETVVTYIPAGSTVDYSCTGGSTGGCSVTVVIAPPADAGKCGQEDCWVRIEYRW